MVIDGRCSRCCQPLTTGDYDGLCPQCRLLPKRPISLETCEHGQLRQSCEICEWKDRAEKAEADKAEAERVIEFYAQHDTGAPGIYVGDGGAKARAYLTEKEEKI